ncbi:ribonuclease P protein component [Mycoplasmopsis canis]|uniref:ribonuclease P protein component n=1 Tax=Mycoplasmopsis canis TaxID=29555 RepID=UPI00025ADC5E|nr:ribonuclease P protein component [Mycoplasmopsis canis]EIE41117.1 ribonuclease P protein component [Mycoplasmopsis canis UF33]EIE42253.1 ribonuclease P protein component [Mycoplasmopsis canis UFG1]
MQKEFRLKKNWDFQEIIDSKQSINNSFLVVYYKKAESFKAGITIPKKFENSVGRNFNKRQLKAIIRELNLYELNYHFVMIARKKFCESEYNFKKQGIDELFKKFRNYAKKTKI